SLTLALSRLPSLCVSPRRCHVEYESRETVAKGDAASRKRLHAYSIFLTELYLHLEVLSGSQRTRAAILRVGVRDVIHTLLAHPTDDNVTCAIKMLKLCGSVLEDDFRLEGKSSMDELMERMKSVVLDGSCERPVRSMLLKLIELRSSNWGRVTPTSTPTPTHCPLTDPDYYMNEPVFYTADGTPFTAADPEFREHYERVMQHEEELRKRFPRAARTATETPDHYYVDSDSDSGEGDVAEDDDENGDGDGDAGMDPEMQAAFEIFCQEAEKKQTKAK
ncbi:polyadenylate-binding protein-interacting protein 1, partial [Petromyzon marinus]|uniref:polyadenylate-binding protein-interacting protein 1 n=1 Tax=Petromyzon marinus TaxID=7757 RepID=UPI003F729348